MYCYFPNVNFNDTFLSGWVIGVYLPFPRSRPFNNPFIIFLRKIHTVFLVMTEILPCSIDGCHNCDLMVGQMVKDLRREIF